MSLIRSAFIAVVLGLSAGLPVYAQGETPAAEAVIDPVWQASITGQIEAFRSGDAESALGFAAAGFHAAFPNATVFYMTIENSPYGAIVNSLRHSFGEFEMVDETTVLQFVDVTAPDQSIYRALYQLIAEPEGWRVAGVQLSEPIGMGV